MNGVAAFLLVAALMSAVLISGCTQQTPAGGGTTGQAINKTAESAAQSAIEQEMNQAVENITTNDIENALLNQ
jgi:PBP1b-binding outer membrane lipoprotein LpoB